MRRRPLLLAVGVALIAIPLYALVLALFYTGRFPGANDFLVVWVGLRAFWLEGQDPYSAEVTATIQSVLFGRLRGPGEHPFDFPYPLTLAPPLLPYVLLPYRWAQPLWQATQHAMLVGGTLLWLRVLGLRRPAPLALGAGLLWLVLLYPAARAFLLGQIAMLLFGALAVALWALTRGRQRLGGAALALLTIKPQIGFLIVPALAWRAWRRGERAVLQGFALALALLVLIPAAILPEWPLRFVDRAREYSGYTSFETVTDAVSPLALVLRAGGAEPLALPLALLAIAAAFLWQARSRPPLVPLSALMLTLTAWITPAAATTDQVVLLFPLLWLLARLPRGPRLAAALVALIAPWWLFALTVAGDHEGQVVRLVLPAVLLACAALSRRVARVGQGVARDAPRPAARSASPRQRPRPPG